MASINLSGILKDPTGEVAVGDQIRFTHRTTTGDTIKFARSVLIIPPGGDYDIDLEFGNILVEYLDIKDVNYKNLGIVTVNGDSTAVTLPELLLAIVPPTDEQLLEFQNILAEAEALVAIFATTEGAENVNTNSNNSVQIELDALSDGQTGGLIVRTTKALLDLITPSGPTEEQSSYKVTDDDISSANNGFYSWNGSIFVADADTTTGEVESGNAFAVSGGTVFDWFEGVKGFSFGVNKAHSSLIQTDVLINNVGAIISIVGWKMIGIPVVPGQVITFGNFAVDSNSHYAFYDDAVLISFGGSYTTGALPITDTVPAGANIMFIDIKTPTNVDADFEFLMINEGSALLPFVTPVRFVNQIDENKLDAEKLSVGNEVPTPLTDFNATNLKFVEDNFNSSDDLFDFSINLFDKSLPRTESFFLDSSGVETANAGFAITDFIRLEPSTDYNWQGKGAGAGTFGAVYDENKLFIRNVGNLVSGSFTTTAEEVFFRESINIDDPTLFMIQKGFTVDLLTPFFKILKEENQVMGWWNDLPLDAEIILINTGQSNSVGGANKSTYEDGDVAENETVMVWNNGTLSWDNQHLDVTTSKVGWNAFMKEHVFKYNRQFKIINGGVSSTDIDFHLPNELGYTDLVTSVENAINNVLASGKRPYVYMIFIQGEADSNSTVDADAYAAKLATWVAQWKTNLGENLPIIQGGIAEFGTAQEILDDIKINDAKRRQYADGIISEFYEVTGFATTDNLHRNRAGYLEEADVIISKIDAIGIGLEITNDLPYTF